VGALHDLRLAALADAPEAFSTTLAQAERRSEAEWQAAAEQGARGDRQCTVVADDARRLVGMVTVYLPEPAAPPDTIPSLIQMQVDPAPSVDRAWVLSLSERCWCGRPSEARPPSAFR
jgi:hypothetical protein